MINCWFFLTVGSLYFHVSLIHFKMGGNCRFLNFRWSFPVFSTQPIMVGQKIQPNPTHYKGPTQLTWVGLDHGLKKNLIAIIIIKLNIRTTPLQTILYFNSASKFKLTHEIRRRLKWEHRIWVLFRKGEQKSK